MRSSGSHTMGNVRYLRGASRRLPVPPELLAPEPAEGLEERNRKVGILLIGVILLLVAISIIGVLTLN